MKMIALTDKKNGIGISGRQIVFIPEDLARFRTLTNGHTVILGRKTLETFPSKKGLPNRRCLVLSRRPGFAAEGVQVFSSADALLKEAGPDAFIIGGESVYRQFLPYCDTAYLTRIDADFESDRFFPALRAEDGWQICEQSQVMKSGALRFCYVTYRRAHAEILLHSERRLHK